MQNKANQLNNEIASLHLLYARSNSSNEKERIMIEIEQKTKELGDLSDNQPSGSGSRPGSQGSSGNSLQPTEIVSSDGWAGKTASNESAKKTKAGEPYANYDRRQDPKVKFADEIFYHQKRIGRKMTEQELQEYLTLLEKHDEQKVQGQIETFGKRL